MSPGGAGGAGGGNLATLAVEFTVKGQAQLVQALDSLKGQFEKIVDAVGQFHFDYLNKVGQQEEKTKALGRSVIDLGNTFQTLSHTINIALGIGQASIVGFIRQGLALGTTGLMLQQRMERLALAISGLFRPEILKITDMIERLTTWLARLSNEQREQVKYWIEAGAAALAMALVFPRIVAGIQAVAAALKVLGVAVGFLEAETGIGALIPLLGLALQGLTALIVGTKGGREGLARLWEATKPLVKALAELAEKLRLGELLEGLGDDFATIVKALADLVSWLTKVINKFNELTNNKGVQILHDIIRGSFLAGVPEILRRLGYGTKLPEVTKDTGTDVYRSVGFEAVENIYTRLATLTVGQRSAAERTADATEATRQAAEQIAQQVAQHRGPVAVGA